MHKKFCAYCGSHKVAEKKPYDYRKQKDKLIELINALNIDKVKKEIHNIPVWRGHTGIMEALQVLSTALTQIKTHHLQDVLKVIEQVEKGENSEYTPFPGQEDDYEDPDHDKENRAKYERANEYVRDRKYVTPRGEKLEEYYGEDSPVKSKQGPYKVKSLDKVKKRRRWEYDHRPGHL